MIVTKPIDLGLLEHELAAGGVVVSALGTFVDQNDATNLHTYDGDGMPADLPPAAVPIVDAHVAPPRFVEYVTSVTVDRITRTTSASVTEVFRLPTEPQHLYRGTFQMMAVDATLGTAKDVEARLAFKQQAGAAVQVGSTVVLSSIQDAQAAAWAIQGSAEGADFVVSVRGAATTTIDWSLRGDIAVYAPEGLSQE